MSFGVDFGQKVDLTASIRNILRNYPEGTAILKELIQNADDAGARRVCLTLDKRSHSAVRVADPNLAAFQGPALLVYNDAVFTKSDFQSIQRIGDSLKRAEEEAKSKIGRFGIGFNAVYHWTDLPSFVSLNYLVMLDPQARFLPNVNPANPGKMVDFIADPSVVATLPDQFAPYKSNDLDWSKPFNGTLFRLPLRTSDQADTSMLSKRALSISEAVELLVSFSHEASSMLLFLKHVEAIEVRIWEPEASEPTMLFSCSICNATSELRTKRNLVLQGGTQNIMAAAKELYSDYTLEIQCRDRGSSDTYSEVWEVCSQLGGGVASAIASDPNNSLLRLIPFAGVAVLVNPTELSRTPMGAAYCFLPLPIQTGLPVMVNGFFELSSNRRDVWQGGSDMTGDGRTRAEWNVSLMRDVISPSYIRLLLRLKVALGFSEVFQGLFPRFSLPTPWNTVSHSVLQRCRDERLLRIGYAIDKSSPFMSPEITTAMSYDMWVPLKATVILPKSSLLSESDMTNVKMLLIETYQVYINCSEVLRDILEEAGICRAVATPEIVRGILRVNCDLLRSLPVTKTFVPSIFQYIVTDLPSRSPHTMLQLNAMPLLPLCSETPPDVGILRTYSESQAEAILVVMDMGFTFKQAIIALNANSFDTSRACDVLTSGASLTASESGSASDMFIIADEEELSVFSLASSILIDKKSLRPSEVALLSTTNLQKYSNVRCFGADIVKDVLKAIIPTVFFEAPRVDINSLKAAEQQRIEAFLPVFWLYILTRPDFLRAVAEGPAIVRTSDNQVLTLSKMSFLILETQSTFSLPEKLSEILVNIGANIVDPNCIQSHMMSSSVVLEYINIPNRQGILQTLRTLFKADRRIFCSKIEHSSSDQKNLLLDFIVTNGAVDLISAEDLDFLKELPLYKRLCDGCYTSLGGSFTTVVDFSHLDSSLFPIDFISHSSPQMLALLRRLGVKCLTRCQFFRTKFLPTLSMQFRACTDSGQSIDPFIVALMALLAEVKEFVEEDKDFFKTLQRFKFVPHLSLQGGVELVYVTDLFDPKEEELLALLNTSFFPIREFQREDLLIVLRFFGLQTSLEWPGIIACANSIAYLSQEESPELKRIRGKHLLNFLDKNIARLSGEEEKKKKEVNTIFTLMTFFVADEQAKVNKEALEAYRQDLLAISWVPFQLESEEQILPWRSTQVLYTAAPCECRAYHDKSLCSASFYIVDQPISPMLVNFLGWNKPIPYRAVAIQLSSISDLFCAAPVELREEQRVKENITALIPQLYQRLNAACATREVVSEITSLLEKKTWIWVGNKFVATERIAYSPSVNAEPFLYGLPQDLAVYRTLLGAFGVRSNFNAQEYVDVLRQLSELGSDTTLYVELAVSLVTLLATDTFWHQGGQSMVGQIYVPDQCGRLLLASELVNDDVPWMAGPEYSSVRVGVNFVHPNISSKVAEKIGVRSLRMLLLNKNLDQLFSVTESSIEAFGQAESLTSRLKTILDMYPDGNPIFSELIQNADDAGANVVRIMIDENTYGTESLLGPSMAELQGPSVIVFNDAKFTDADFKSLASIGQGSKLDRLAATGRFGLGFNSVYHITDTPTFVSGDYLVLFDPHTINVPGASFTQPGLRIRFKSSHLDKSFPDQFSPYRFFGCNFEDAFEGTLFRLPLRSSKLAKISEISKRAYSISDVNTIVGHLQSNLAQHLLFLRSVKAIEIFRCPLGSSEPILLHRAASVKSDVRSVNDPSLLQFLEKKSPSGSTALTSRESFYATLSKIPESQLPSSSYRIIINTSSTTLDDGMEEDQKSYYVVTGLKGGEARQLACDSSTRNLKLIPMGSVACCISPEVKFIPLSGQAFCFLPLPVKTALPVHINGYFELSSNRRDIWRGDDTSGESKLRSTWNQLLLRDVLTPLYATLICDIVRFCLDSGDNNISSIQELIALFPCPAPAAPWDLVTKGLFDLLKSEKVLYSRLHGGSLLSFDTAFLLDSEDQRNIGSLVIDRAELENMLLLEEIPVVSLKTKVFETIKENAKSLAGVISPQFIRYYFIKGSYVDKWFRRDKYRSLLDPESKHRNAVFWLHYCMSDISHTDPSPLYGIQLMPMEDGSLGTIGEPTDQTIFIATDCERKLLPMASKLIIAADSVLGSYLTSRLSKSDFIELTNIKKLTPVDVLKLLRTFLPASWSSPDNLIVDREGVLSDSWLRTMWEYLVSSKSLDLYIGLFPLLPVVSPTSASSEKFIVQVSPNVPVLHIDHRSSMSDGFILDALFELGVYVCDETLLGSVSFTQTLDKLLVVKSPIGILDALSAIPQGRRLSVVESWSAEKRDSFRGFLLQEVVVKSKGLSSDQLQIILNLPIWQRCEGRENAPTYCDLGKMSENGDFLMKLPPKLVEHYILTPEFVFLKDESERLVYSKMGLLEMKLGEFICEILVDQIKLGQLDSKMDDVSVFILNNMSTIERDSGPDAVSILGQTAFVLVASGKRLPPKDLYDPSVNEFRLLLSPNLFPCSSIYSHPHFTTLRRLGLNTSFSTSAIIKAASNIEAAVNHYLSQDPPDESVIRDILQRGNELLKYLDINILDLMKEVDPDGLQEFQNLNGLASSFSSSDDAIAASKRKEIMSRISNLKIGGDWASDLRQIRWVPVMTSPPSRDTVGLVPWPERIHSLPMAAPSQCVLQTYVCMASNSQRVVAMTPNSSLLASVLGWSRPISGRIVALQLIGLVNIFQSANASETPKVAGLLYSVVPKVYDCLLTSMDIESTTEVDLWVKLLRGKSAIWIGGHFVEPSRVAFNSVSSSVNTEPFLYTVKDELMPYTRLLVSLGVRSHFEVNDMLAILHDIEQKNHTVPLSARDMDLVVGIVKMAYRMITQPIMATVTADEVYDDGGKEPNVPVVTAVAVPLTASSVNSTTVQEYGSWVVLPDVNRVLVKASTLTFDDAPWISAALNQRGSSIQFVHNEIGKSEAKLFGAKSLREQLFSGDEIVCPNVKVLQQSIQGESVLSGMMDLIGLADLLAAKSCHVILDERTHSSESLMHPGLATCQGAAMLVFYEDVYMTSEEIIRLLSKSELIPILQPQQSRDKRNPGGEDPKARYPTSGTRLLSSFSITDCLQILTGSNYFVFDPSGEFLFSGDADGGAVRGGEDSSAASASAGINSNSGSKMSRAQKCDISSRDILNRFPDQFRTMLSLNLKPARNGSGIGGTVVRMPIRSFASVVSNTTCSLIEAKDVIKSLYNVLEPSLVFAQHVNTYSLVTISNLGITNQSVRFSLPNSDYRSSLFKLLKEKGWKTTGLASMFAQFTPIENVSKIMIRISEESVDDSDQRLSVERDSMWLLNTVLGAPAIRDMAARAPYRPLKLHPIVSVATNISKELMTISPDIAPPPGFIFCGNQPLRVLGIPYFVEGPFIHDLITRDVDLSVADNRRNSTFSFMESSAAAALSSQQTSAWNSALLQTAFDSLLPNAVVNLKDVFAHEPSALLESFYRMWPYQSRMPEEIARLSTRSQLLEQLASLSIYLCNQRFKKLGESFILKSDLTPAVGQYLGSYLPLSSVPVRASNEIVTNLGIRNDPSYTKLMTLTPSKLREVLKSDRASHLATLNRNHKILFSLLDICLSDYSLDASLGEFAIRRAYIELAGCPLLLMANQEVATFPVDLSSRVAIAPYALHRLLPELLPYFVHPYLLRHNKIFHNAAFKDATMLSFFNGGFLSNHISKILPRSYHCSLAVKRPLDSSYEGPSDSLLYALWRFGLSKENAQGLDPLAAWPIVPVVSRQRRILISPKILPFCLVMLPTTDQDSYRFQLGQEMTQHDDQVNVGFEEQCSAFAELNKHEEGCRDMWSWSATCTKLSLANRKQSVSSSAADGSSSVEHSERESVVDTVTAAETFQSAVRDAQARSNHNPAPPQEAPDLRAITACAISISPSSTGDLEYKYSDAAGCMRGALSVAAFKLGVPFLDSSIFDGAPLSLAPGRSLGRQLLECMYFIESNYVRVSSPLPVEDAQEFLNFEMLNFSDRNQILLEILATHNQHALTADEVKRLKTLRLLTKSTGESVAIGDCTSAFWCTSEAALEGIALPGLQNTQLTSSVIIRYEPQLRVLYMVLGIEELTPSTAIKRFTVPVLGSLPLRERLDILKALSSKWGNYATDAELVNALKGIAFVPTWTQENNGYWECNYNAEPVKASDVFSWNNTELMTALQGRNMTSYFVPPLMRTPEWAALLTSLGMKEDIDKEGLIRIAKGIETIRRDDELHAASLGRKILRYIKEVDRISAIFDHDLAKRASKILFVPADIPVKCEAGGYVSYEERVVSFDQTVSKANGALAFTLVPIIEDDIVPDQMFASALGIMYVPPLEIVLRHLKNLVSNGDSLDRWNSKLYSINDTFNTIFSFLKDHWREIQPSIQQSLKCLNVIPVKQILVKPSRLFFRLAEDLSPFMHELPRVFGSHEIFLKNIGVKECPSGDDYFLFLSELCSECQGNRLNPNELKAVVAIIHSIMEAPESAVREERMFVPDEDGILRDASQCLYCDSTWLKLRCSSRMKDNNIYLLHPLVPLDCVKRLGSRRLSEVLSESLVSVHSPDYLNSDAQELTNILKDSLFIQSLCAFIATIDSGPENGRPNSQEAITELTANLLVAFIPEIQVVYRLQDPRNTGSQLDVGTQTRLSFIADTESVQKTILVSSIQLLPPVVTADLAVAAGLCDALRINTSYSGTISILLQSARSHETDILSHLQIANGGSKITHHARGQPGALVLAQDEAYLELKPFRIFRVGEVVALKGTHGDGAGGICYGKILAVGDSGEGGLRRLRIATGNSMTVEALSTEVYSFKSARDLPAVSTVLGSSTSPHGIIKPIDTSTTLSRAAVTGGGNSEAATALSGGFSAVSRDELMGTLNGLLHRLNIPTSLEADSLMTRVVELTAETQRLDNQLHEERSNLSDAIATVNKLSVAMRCQICLTNEVTHVLAPCGHTICGDCSAQLQRNKCPFCRTNIQIKVRFFSQLSDVAPNNA